jgi:two-component system nitrogen regulation sensor histidine kinase NtrY
VELEDRRLLLQLYRVDPVRARRGPGAVDWLLTGAVLAALVVLVITGRIERRLSVSLRNLVRLADALLAGEPPGDVARPPETDLAGVLDAVRSMHEEVRRRETTLRHQEELLRVTLSTLAPAVMVLEADGTVRFANPAAERLLSDHRDEVLACVRDAAGDPRIEGGTTIRTVSPRPGEEMRWRVGVADAPLPDGRRGLVAVVDDVTDLVQADRLRQLNQLARIVAHEVKNPLTPVRLWVQELDEARRRGEPLEPVVEEASREIALQVDRLQETASSFSNLVALEQWRPERIDLRTLTGEVVRDLAVVERRGVRLSHDVPDDPVRVNADRQWLRRAVVNLVRNSLDAISDGPGHIRLSVRGESGTAVVEVADSGGGVPDEQLEDLFEPHFSTTSGGSGLGLALVRHIVARCHGRVTATNGDEGLVVRLEMPLLR